MMMRRRPAGTCAQELRPSGAARREEPLRGSTRIGLFAYASVFLILSVFLSYPVALPIGGPTKRYTCVGIRFEGDPHRNGCSYRGMVAFATRRRRLFHHRAVGCGPMHTRFCKPVQLVPPDDHANAQANTSPFSSAPELDVQRRDRQRRCVPQRVLVLKNGTLEPRHTSGKAVKLPS